MKSIRLSWIIHIFAVLHAVTALGCRLAGVDDELLLTVLTMALALIICLKKDLSIEFTAAIIIIMNILGFLLGTFGASLLKEFIPAGYVVNALATAITTEILGWSVAGMTRMFRQDTKERSKDALSSSYLKWFILIAGGIFVLRLLIVALFSRSSFGEESMTGVTEAVISNSFALTILICINILYVRFVTSGNLIKNRWLSAGMLTVFMLLATFLEAFMAGGSHGFIPVFIVSLIAQVAIYCIVYMINYAITARNEMQAEREKANMAQYRYLKLKRQVNPHFLFNSLNILDCLICEEKTEQASTYTHKLAGIYRYMLKSEDEEVVPLRDELDFVRQYTDLLQVRFPKGFAVNIDVPEDKLARFVPPCSIQLLVENATKHNAVSVEKPLVIDIKAVGDNVRVCNNVVPKLTKAPSTGLGQQYIRQIYLDLSGKDIDIDKTEDNYCVTLPLL